MTDSDGQKITIHEEIFSNAKIAVSGNVEENAESKEMPAAMGGKKVFSVKRCILFSL